MKVAEIAESRNPAARSRSAPRAARWPPVCAERPGDHLGASPPCTHGNGKLGLDGAQAGAVRERVEGGLLGA